MKELGPIDGDGMVREETEGGLEDNSGATEGASLQLLTERRDEEGRVRFRWQGRWEKIKNLILEVFSSVQAM